MEAKRGTSVVGKPRKAGECSSIMQAKPGGTNQRRRSVTRHRVGDSDLPYILRASSTTDTHGCFREEMTKKNDGSMCGSAMSAETVIWVVCSSR